MGANSYRTSHYPYAEEILDFADQNGIVIIGNHFLSSPLHDDIISLIRIQNRLDVLSYNALGNENLVINSFYAQMSVLQWPLTTLTTLFWKTTSRFGRRALPHCCAIFPCYLVWKSTQRPNEQWRRLSSWAINLVGTHVGTRVFCEVFFSRWWRTWWTETKTGQQIKSWEKGGLLFCL